MRRIKNLKALRIIILLVLISIVHTSHSVEETDQNTLKLEATKDFIVINAGDAPYYKDKRHNALAIDARLLEYRQLFAQAVTKFDGDNGFYDITLTSMTEEDGEPLYKLVVNGDIVGTYRGTYIGAKSPLDLTSESHTWKSIPLQKGDIIGIKSNAHTNGEIPENGGTAWARGRWNSLEFTPAPEQYIPRFPAAFQRKNFPMFSQHKDMLISQFDFKPDVDDVHAVAALGSMLKHPDLQSINHIAVAGTVGVQGGNYTDASTLMGLAFGRENFSWTDANKNWNASIQFVRDRAKAILAQGGRVWVQEAGQSDFTRTWVLALIKSGVNQSLIKNNIIVVQHSKWNEKHTSEDALQFVNEMTTYIAIDDGNKPKRVFDRKNRRGPFTPSYVEKDTRWINAAISNNNGKEHAKTLWQEAKRIIDKTGFDAKYSVIPDGGVDFSDNVEVWWIFNLGQSAVSVHSFWERYVTDLPLDSIKPPRGRLAVVIDGNSPDPDDIGATPVMLALLQQTELNDRLVHLSHSCDLDPFKNKGRQIGPEDEVRRQNVLHKLSGNGIQYFGPFDNLNDYYNCRTHQDEARDDLVAAINASSKNDPLWIIEAGEPDLIGYALQKANPQAIRHVHVVSHHPANDHSGDYFTWQEILDFGVIEHQIGDQNVALQTPIYHWDWAKNHDNAGYRFIWEMLAYAEQDGVVPFQTNKFDCSDAGMIYWWITGANDGGNNFATPSNIKDMLSVK